MTSIIDRMITLKSNLESLQTNNQTNMNKVNTQIINNFNNNLIDIENNIKTIIGNLTDIENKINNNDAKFNEQNDTEKLRNQLTSLSENIIEIKNIINNIL